MSKPQRITITLDVVTDLDADTLERRLETFLDPADLNAQLLDDERIEVKQTLIVVSEPDPYALRAIRLRLARGALLHLLHLLRLRCKPRFQLGRLYQTSGVETAIPRAALHAALRRYAACDFGELDAEDCAVNESAIVYGSRILGSYKHEGIVFWLITDPDRQRTTALLPDEY